MQNDGFLPVTVFQDDRYTNVFYWGLLPKFCPYWNLNPEKTSPWMASWRKQAWKTARSHADKHSMFFMPPTGWIWMNFVDVLVPYVFLPHLAWHHSFATLTEHDWTMFGAFWRCLKRHESLGTRFDSTPAWGKRCASRLLRSLCRCRPCVVDIGWIWVPSGFLT